MKEMINLVHNKDQSKKQVDGGEGLVNINQSSTGERDLQVWRRKLDDMTSKTKKKSEHHDGMQDRLKEIKIQQTDLQRLSTKQNSNSESNPLKKMRILENKLDKAMIKFNEAISIKKTYEIIFKRLSEERVAYKKQLESLEQ